MQFLVQRHNTDSQLDKLFVGLPPLLLEGLQLRWMGTLLRGSLLPLLLL
jgi:hypothetical protein